MEFHQICDIQLIKHFLSNNGSSPDADEGNKTDLNLNENAGTCSLYFPKLVFDILFIYVALLILIYEKCRNLRKCKWSKIANVSKEKSEEIKIKNLFQVRTVFVHHVPFWCFTLFLFLCECGNLAENLILHLHKNTNAIETLDENDIHEFLTIIGPLINLIAICVLLLFFHQIEKWRKPRFLLIVLVFFKISAIFYSANVYIYLGILQLKWGFMKVLINVCGVVTTVTLFVLVTRILIHERCCKKSQSSSSSKTKKDLNIRYLHNYSSLPSRTTFYWFTSLLRLGYWHPLEEEDLGDLPDEEKTFYQLQRFQNCFDTSKKESFSLWKSLLKTVWPSMLIGGLFRIVADFIGFIPPLGIKTIVAYTELNYTLFEQNKNENDTQSQIQSMMEDETGFGEYLTISQLISNGYVMALVVLLASVLQSTFSQCSTFLVNSEGIHVKFALQALIYKKSLSLSPTKHSQNDILIPSNSNSDNDNEPIMTDDDGIDGITRPDLDSDGDVDKESGISSTCRSNNETLTSGVSSSTHSSTVFDNGLIVNVMSEDANNIMMFFWMAHFIWAIPLKLVVLMTLLYLQLGYSALIGAGVCILIMIPLQFLVGKKMSCNSKELMERCDERLRTMSEILQGMKLLKLHGWELIFCDRVDKLREKELKNLDKDLLFRSIMTFLTHISSVFMTVVTFGLYQFIETEKLEPPKVFAGLALFNQLTVPLFIFPIIVPVVIDATVSARRVRDFLLLPEVATYLPDDENDSEKPQPSEDDDNFSRNKRHQSSDIQASSDSVFILENIAEDDEDAVNSRKNSYECDLSSQKLIPKSEALKMPPNLEKQVVSVKNAYFTWDIMMSSDRDRPRRQSLQTQSRNIGLSKISVEIPKEKLTVIVGPTGSGKSAFISALLGEMNKTSGELVWGKGVSISYASQKPWILNASVRENILFGKSFKPGRYKKVIEACALQPDIDILAEKDMTEIGQRGINLSGGQKSRISIARALYSNSSVVILDDPLSALDLEVAHHVLDAGILKFLLRSRRTVILVTHHLPVLHHANNIIAMENGRIRIQGTLSEIQKSDPECYQVWREMITRKEHELKVLRETRTAKERWTLLKLVSKVGIQLKYTKPGEKMMMNDDGRADMELFQPRTRKGTFSHYKHLSHDMFLPSDECHDELMTPLLRRRQCKGMRTSRESRITSSSSGGKDHIQLRRMSSLQPEAVTKTKSPLIARKFKRLQSLPVDDDVPTVKVFGSKKPRSKTLSSTSSTGGGGPPADAEKISASSRISSTISSVGELTEEDEVDEEEQLLQRESSQDEREYGKIPWRVYLSYISACGKMISVLYLLTAIGYEVVRVYTNLWLSEWSDSVYEHRDDQRKYEEIMEYYFNVYVLLSLGTVVVSLSCNLLGRRAGANSREILHQRMLHRVVRCPVRFFEGTPMGYIINRFSSDVAVVDRKLCISMQRFLQFVFLCCSAIVVNAIVNVWFIFVAIPIVAVYFYIQRFYRFSSRELQRIQAISRGPIYSHFHETLEGLSTIRAYRVQHRFTNQMLTTLDAHNIADMFINVGNRWLSISLDYLGGVIVFLATLVALISSEMYPEAVTASMVGLAINYTLLVPVYLNWVIKFLAEVEMFMNSVDRINRYSQLDIEDYEGQDSLSELPRNWPSKGEVKFEEVTIYYGEDRPPIISELKVDITPQQKVGICGRSGSGKSSLLMALFRISDVKSGRILIDGVDIHKIPLLKLRSSFSIIPQENFLFSGTLRFNLDPEGRIPDIEIWNALQHCQLETIVREMHGQLDAEVSSSGQSFSAGEKQLLALARAILHKSKVVVMDEATSSVDLWTERTLLQAVKDTFKDSTVLTVAHRLDTIVDGDRVLVLEDGKLAEDGNPVTLMKQPSSHFATMIKNSEQNR